MKELQAKIEHLKCVNKLYRKVLNDCEMPVTRLDTLNLHAISWHTTYSINQMLVEEDNK